MALSKDRKKEVLAKIKDILGRTKSLVFVAFKGLSVADSAILRSDLRANESGLLVVKKTLLKKALAESGFLGEIPDLSGEIALGFGQDTVLPAKTVKTFGKQNDNKVSLVGGVIDNRFLSQTEITELADIPGIKELYGMFVNVINSPIQGLVIALDAMAKKREV